ncbi:MAG: DUF4426 domain-containing protein [gamma proteobacterium symbiont of Bathyaustriella thionipta]|nr:DUF4426 domain-containing protein [gamma proteobacterium symbiont of Bathyaustriella thionipta]
MYKKLLLLLSFNVLLLPTLVMAENSTSVPGYTIHHNAFTTDILTPHIAHKYHVQRSKNRGMLNVSIIKNETIGIGKSVPAQVEVTATNLTGQLRNINMREARSGTAIYYLGDFRVNNQETLNFIIKVRPAGSSETATIKLNHQFYTQ